MSVVIFQNIVDKSLLKNIKNIFTKKTVKNMLNNSKTLKAILFES